MVVPPSAVDYTCLPERRSKDHDRGVQGWETWPASVRRTWVSTPHAYVAEGEAIQEETGMSTRTRCEEVTSERRSIVDTDLAFANGELLLSVFTETRTGRKKMASHTTRSREGGLQIPRGNIQELHAE